MCSVSLLFSMFCYNLLIWKKRLGPTSSKPHERPELEIIRKEVAAKSGNVLILTS